MQRVYQLMYLYRVCVSVYLLGGGVIVIDQLLELVSNPKVRALAGHLYTDA